MNLVAIRNEIISKLYSYIDKPIILGNQVNTKPSYPFMTYNINNVYIKGLGREIEKQEIVASENEDFEFDIKIKLTEQAQFVFSFSAYSDDIIECYELAELAREYFSGKARMDFTDFVVVEISNINSVDTLIVDEYERRAVFDVRFRTVNEVEFNIETIEELNINDETYEL